MTATRPGLSRRTVLRGALGATLALPWMESFSAPRQRVAPPRRFLLCSGGFSLATGEDPVLPHVFEIDGVGADYTPTVAMAPLAGVRDLFSVVSGLNIPIAGVDGVVPPAGRVYGIAPFHSHSNPLLAGNRQKDGCDFCVTGPSPDQVVADVLGQSSPFRSLALRVQVDGYTPAAQAGFGVLSHRKVADKTVPVLPISSPRLAWLSLTGGGVQSSARLYELEQRRSVLDLVDRRGQGLLSKLGATDRDRLNRHFDEIRDLELRLAQPTEASGACQPPEAPGDDPVSTSSFYYNDEDMRARLMHELLRYALACDLTRSASLMYTFWKSEIGTAAFTDFDWTLHECQHFGTRDQLVQIVQWHMGLWADLLALLQATPDGDGTLLDHCAVVYQPEGGAGTLESGDRSHSTEEMVSFVAGRAGGLAPGRHIVASGRHPAEVYLTAMEAAGAPQDAHGEVTGGVPELFG